MNNEDLLQDVTEVVYIGVQLGLVPIGLVANDPLTAAQVAIARIPIHYLMEMPALAAMYCQARLFTLLHQQLATSHVSRTPSQTRWNGPQPPRSTRHSLPRSQTTTGGPSGPGPVTPREPEPVPGQSEVPTPPVVRARTEKQMARKKRKFKNLREKMKARKRQANNTG